MDLREIDWGCGLDSTGSCNHFDEPADCGKTQLVRLLERNLLHPPAYSLYCCNCGA
jgi:hypothetical protein